LRTSSVAEVPLVAKSIGVTTAFPVAVPRVTPPILKVTDLPAS
jgi:hypothetical protein